MENETFVIDNDVKAEWALKKIAEEQEDTQRYISVCDTMIAEYALKKQQATEKFQNKTFHLKSQLQAYFKTVPHKVTKTQETYQLPSGKLKLKLTALEYIKNDEKLVKFLKDNGMKDYIQAKESPLWGELKKVVKVSGENVVTEDGQIVEGVTVQEKPMSFEIDFD